MISLVDITTATEQSDIVSCWLPTVAISTKMHPSQSKPLMKLPISIEQGSLRFDTNALIYSAATTMSFLSQ